MNSSIKRVVRLAQKELREILRDRRTIVTLVAMPLLLYPLMSVVFLQFSLLNKDPSGSGPKYVIAALSAGEELAFQQRLSRGEAAIERQREKKANDPKKPALKTPEFLAYVDGQRPRTKDEREETLARLEQAMRDKVIDLIVRIPGAESATEFAKTPTEDRAFECKLIVLSNSTRAQAAIAYIEETFAAANEADLKARLGAPHAKLRITLLHLERVVLAAPSEEPFAALVPLILILLTITGAVYPAIDLTAGERERGTLEILVAAPVSRFELLSAKYISVMTVAMMTAVVNLVCMAITVVTTGLLGERQLSPLLLVEGLGLLVLFAAFFSAVLLCVTSFARSFKEAQAYLIPLMLGSLTPGVVAMMPGLKLEGTLMALPLVNIVLMARDLLSGGVDAGVTVVVIATTLLYAIAALALAARVFGAESVLYSEQSSWADLLRRPAERQPTASVPAMLWCLALMVPIYFAANGLLRMLVSDPAHQVVLVVVLNVVVTLMMFLGLPGLFAYLGRVDLMIGLGMRVRSGPALAIGIAAGLILGLSLWPIELWLLSQSDIHQVLQERFSAVLQNIRAAHDRLGWGVLVTVIVPAILEEFFFRGLLFHALRRRTGALATIGVTAGLFALTHVVLGGPLGLERLMPSLLLGLILSTVCWLSGSVWPSVVLHVCHNTILMIVGMGGLGPKEEVPLGWRLAGLAGIILGAALVGLLVYLQQRKEVKLEKE